MAGDYDYRKLLDQVGMSQVENARLQLYILNLEDAVDQGQNTIEFLHACLLQHKNPTIRPRSEYIYPEMTVAELKRMEKVHKRQPGCGHSMFSKGCQSCEYRVERYKLKAQLTAIVEGRS